MARIFLCSSAVRVYDSQAYRKMDVTRERISWILEKCSCCSKLVSLLSMLLLSALSWRVSQAWNRQNSVYLFKQRDACRSVIAAFSVIFTTLVKLILPQ